MTSLEDWALSDNRLSGERPGPLLGTSQACDSSGWAATHRSPALPSRLFAADVADNDCANRRAYPFAEAATDRIDGPSERGRAILNCQQRPRLQLHHQPYKRLGTRRARGSLQPNCPGQFGATPGDCSNARNRNQPEKHLRDGASGLRDEWWPTLLCSTFARSMEVQLGACTCVLACVNVYKKALNTERVVDVKEAIVISDALPGYPKGFRVRSWMCESQVRAHGSERGETLDSFRIVTIPSPYYQQFIFTNGVTVKATDGVDPAALRAGADIVVTMLSGRQDLARCMAQRGAALAIIPRDQPVTTLPEYAHLRGTYDFTGRSRDTFDLRGVGAAEPLHPVSSAGEEQLLGQFGPQHPYYSYRGWVGSA